MGRKTVVGIACFVAALPLCADWHSGGTQSDSNPYAGARATAWPEADRLFRSDPRWLGGDGAYSVDLGGGRVLWFFGDSFIANKAGAKRREAAFVRNSVAIETGYDPSKTSLEFFWKTRNGVAQSFVGEKGSAWLWPMDGIRLGNRLLLFFCRVRSDSSKESLGFEVFDWTAFLVSNPDESPSAWKLQRIAVPNTLWRMVGGESVLRVGNFVYAFGSVEASGDIDLLRWPVSAAARGDLSAPEWWCGPERGWVTQASGMAAPAAVISKGPTELSVQWDPQRGKFLEVESLGFGGSDIAVRWADRIEGPWPEPMKVYRPPESDGRDPFVYGGKAHAEVSGADVVVTYTANGSDETLATDMSIYYPRFVRINFPMH